MRNHYFKKILNLILILCILAYPFITNAQLIPCGQTVVEKNSTGQIISSSIPHPCTFNDLVTLVNNLVDFIFVKISLPIAAIMFTYAGFKLMFSGGQVEAKSKAIKIFTNVAFGLVIIAGSWVIIHTIISILGDEIGYKWIGF